MFVLSDKKREQNKIPLNSNKKYLKPTTYPLKSTRTLSPATSNVNDCPSHSNRTLLPSTMRPALRHFKSTFAWAWWVLLFLFLLSKVKMTPVDKPVVSELLLDA